MLLSTAYLPPVSYFQKIAASEEVWIEQHENFVKQTYRNRCHILGANGMQRLIVPLVNTHEKTPITEKKIAYTQNWQHQHWKSIESAYRNAPYFIYYVDEVKVFYEKRWEFLIEYNTAILQTLLKILGIKTQIRFTEHYQESADNDFRNTISPKESPLQTFSTYTQVFSDRHGFQQDLSIIDMLFNAGPECIDLLRT